MRNKYYNPGDIYKVLYSISIISHIEPFHFVKVQHKFRSLHVFVFVLIKHGLIPLLISTQSKGWISIPYIRQLTIQTVLTYNNEILL